MTTSDGKPTCPQWESFGGTYVDPLDRMKVEGGWVYRVTHWTHEGDVICTAVCFVPDVPALGGGHP